MWPMADFRTVAGRDMASIAAARAAMDGPVLKRAEYGAALRSATRAAYNLGHVPDRGDEFLRRERRREGEHEVMVQRSQLDRGLARARMERGYEAAQDAEAGLLVEPPDPVAIRVQQEVMAQQVRAVASAEAFE